MNLIKMRSVVGLVILVSGSLVQVDILELSRFPCPGDAFMGLGLMMVKELYLKLTLGMAEKKKTQSPLEIR